MANDPPVNVGEGDQGDENAKAKRDAKQAQGRFTYLIDKLRRLLIDLAQEFPRSTIVVMVDSPFAHNKFRVCVSRHSAHDPAWDRMLEDSLKEAIIYKTNFAKSKLEIFHHSPPAISEGRLLAALERCLADGHVAANQYNLILETVKKMEKEEKKEALESQ